jgi:hypothetical protein
MNTDQHNKKNLSDQKTLKEHCLQASRRLLKRIDQAKSKIVAEFRDVFQAQEHLLQLAISEADALAWQTDYPHLIFPLLATEKIQSAAHWQARQQALRLDLRRDCA